MHHHADKKQHYKLSKSGADGDDKDISYHDYFLIEKKVVEVVDISVLQITSGLAKLEVVQIMNAAKSMTS